MKILELTNYSAGICGVWTRVKEEAVRLSDRGHKVLVFSSNRTKGNSKVATSRDKVGKVKIFRFPAKKMGGESFMNWNFEKEALEFKPEIIMAHSYRHLHTTKALKLAKKLGAKVFLVTHAPFVEKNTTRGIKGKISVNIYDKLVGPRTLNKFNKIITITKWENEYLKKLNVKKEKITYIPNGIPEEFFKQKKYKEQNKILFFGRISPIKNIEVLIKAFSKIKDKKITLEIVGPSEQNYFKKLNNLVKNLRLQKRIIFLKPIYNQREIIKKMDSCKIFVLPSKREAMPQSLIYAMAREKIVISSDNPGSKELVSNGKNGFLFRNNSFEDLAKKIDLSLKIKGKKIQIQAKKSVERFSWDKMIRKLENLF